MIHGKKEFEDPEKVDEKLSKLIIDDFPEKVWKNLKTKDIKV